MKNLLGVLACIGIMLLPGVIELMPFWLLATIDIIGLVLLAWFVAPLFKAGDHNGR